MVPLTASCGAFTLEHHYSPITAAVEKIPLSVVEVNNKPQYLVFSLHFANRF
jgi:hypothetical protein